MILNQNLNGGEMSDVMSDVKTDGITQAGSVLNKQAMKVMMKSDITMKSIAIPKIGSPLFISNF